MARLMWYLLCLALVVALVVGASWALAYNTVAGLLGSPPPEMGTQTTTFLWDGVTTQRGHPRAWRFVFVGTHIPGAPTVQIYVSPIGRLIQATPPDLPTLVRKLHPY